MVWIVHSENCIQLSCFTRDPSKFRLNKIYFNYKYLIAKYNFILLIYLEEVYKVKVNGEDKKKTLQYKEVYENANTPLSFQWIFECLSFLI